MARGVGVHTDRFDRLARAILLYKHVNHTLVYQNKRSLIKQRNQSFLIQQIVFNETFWKHNILHVYKENIKFSNHSFIRTMHQNMKQQIVIKFDSEIWKGGKTTLEKFGCLLGSQ